MMRVTIISVSFRRKPESPALSWQDRVLSLHYFCMKTGFVYIMTNRPRGVLYTGVTSRLAGRVWEHRTGLNKGYTSRYRIRMLVWFEVHADIVTAIRREKQIKDWKRDWKIQLIEWSNPYWDDLYDTIL